MILEKTIYMATYAKMQLQDNVPFITSQIN